MGFSDELLEHLAWSRQEHTDTLETRRALLDRCVEELDADDRHLLRHCYQPETTFKSAAEDLGRSAPSVYKALKRIRMALMHCVDRHLHTEGAT